MRGWVGPMIDPPVVPGANISAEAAKMVNGMIRSGILTQAGDGALTMTPSLFVSLMDKDRGACLDVLFLLYAREVPQPTPEALATMVNLLVEFFGFKLPAAEPAS